MRKNLVLIAFMLGLFTFLSCEKEGTMVKINETPTLEAILTPVSPDGMEFVKEDADDKIGFSWAAADYGFLAATTYGIQLSLADDFASSVTIMKTTKIVDSVKVKDINGALLTLEMEIGVEATVKCRIYSVLIPGVDTVYSPVTEYTVTPYDELIDYPMVYVPGDYQGWTPGAVNGRLFSYGFNNDYENILRLNANAFLINPEANWDNKWGLGTLTPSGDDFSGTLVAGGGDITVAAGCFNVQFNTQTLAVSFTKTDDWGIIGSAVPVTGWDSDVDMFYNGQRKMWEITADFIAGEFKFRPNDNWGGDFPGNIPLAEDGNYTIRMETVGKTYTITKN